MIRRTLNLTRRSITLSIATASFAILYAHPASAQDADVSLGARPSCPINAGTRRFTINQAEPRGPLGHGRQQFVVAPMIPYAMNHYVPYGAARAIARAMDRLNVDVLQQAGTFQGVPFYADASARGAPEFLFVLDEGSCQLQPYQELSCLAKDMPNLFITVLDASGQPLRAEPRVQVRDDRGFEEGGVTADFRGVVERPGSYDVTIQAPGYHPWRASNITVPPGVCGGQMVFITAYLNADQD